MHEAELRPVAQSPAEYGDFGSRQPMKSKEIT